MVSDSSIRNFRSSLRGQSFCPGEQGYNAARTIPNAMIDRRPAIIARCAGPADVMACVRFAREHDVLVSVRGGGHGVAGKSVCEGGLMIDLSASSRSMTGRINWTSALASQDGSSDEGRVPDA
jgi:FAD/FMN-containing dehydrogenase